MLFFLSPFHGMKAQEPLPQDRLLNIQSDTLLQALERALFPPDATLIRIRDYPDCWAYEMKIDTNRLVRLPQPDHRAVGELLRIIAYTKDYRYFEPVMAMYLRHQVYYKNEWEDVRKNIKYGCEEKNHQVSIMLTMENTLRALEYVNERWSCEQIWEEYQNIRNLNYRVSRDIGDFLQNTEAYPFYSDYFREVRRMRYSWFAYRASVMSYSPYMECMEPYILEQCASNLNIPLPPEDNPLQDTTWRKASYLFTNNLFVMTSMFSPAYEQWLMDNFDRIRELRFGFSDVFRYAQYNTQVSNRYVEFMLDKLFEHPMFDTLDYLDMEGWCNNLIHPHTRQVIKSYLLTKANSMKASDRVKAFAMLVQFPEEDVLDLFLIRARSRHTTEEEMDVLYNNFKRINQGKYFSDKRHEEVKRRLKRMAPKDKKQGK